MIEFFSYGFIERAMIVGALVSLCAALLGAILVLKRYSMIGDGLSHVGFGAIAIGAAANLTPMYFALPMMIISAFVLLKLSSSSNSKMSGDSAIAIISSSALAIGITVCSVTGMNSDLNSYLFGSILATSKEDAILAIILAVIIIVSFFIFYNKIFAVTFDDDFAKATGTPTNVYNMVIAVLTALTIVIGMRVMGTLLISALIIFPSLTSMRLFRNFKGVIISSVVISLFCFFTGMIVSFNFDTPTGATVVLVNLAMFIIFWIISKETAEAVSRRCLACIRGIMFRYFSRCCSFLSNIRRYGFCLL